jgi:hypothetical protein
MAPSDTQNGVAEEEGLMTLQSVCTEYIEWVLERDEWWTL